MMQFLLALGTFIAGLAGLYFVGMFVWNWFVSTIPTIMAFLGYSFVVIVLIHIIVRHGRPLINGYYWLLWIPGSTIGYPEIAAKHWRYQTGSTCAVNAQRVILSLCGVECSENELVKRLTAYGKHSRMGSSDVKLLMEGYGLDVREIHYKKKASFTRCLYDTLNDGRLAIILVNSSLLNLADVRFNTEAKVVPDHAIIVTALRTIKKGHVEAYYTDSGSSDGRVKTVNVKVLCEITYQTIIQSPRLFSPRKQRFGKKGSGLPPL